MRAGARIMYASSVDIEEHERLLRLQLKLGLSSKYELVRRALLDLADRELSKGK